MAITSSALGLVIKGLAPTSDKERARASVARILKLSFKAALVSRTHLKADWFEIVENSEYFLWSGKQQLHRDELKVWFGPSVALQFRPGAATRWETFVAMRLRRSRP